MDKCPGSAIVRRPEIVVLTCPKCGEEVEIFSDEEKAACECGEVIFREKTVSCTDWCKYAKECLEKGPLKAQAGGVKGDI